MRTWLRSSHEQRDLTLHHSVAHVTCVWTSRICTYPVVHVVNVAKVRIDMIVVIVVYLSKQ
jgi:hypothetical protein